MDVMITRLIETPIGAMNAVALGDAIVSLEFQRSPWRERLEGRVRRHGIDATIASGESGVIDEVERWAARYVLSGVSHSPPKIAELGSEFDLAVWKALRALPLGVTATYGELAIEMRTSARAIGRACGRNLIMLITPCHRIVGGAAIGGYAGASDMKRSLLDIELAHVSSRCTGSSAA